MSWLDAFSAGGGGGQSIGLAQGDIRIKTQSLAQSRAVVLRESRLMGQALRSVGPETEKGVAQAERALGRFSQTLNSIGSAMKVALAAVTGLGLRSAQSVKMLEARFRVLSGSEAAAVKNLTELRDMAEDLDQPFLEIAEGATAIMPALRGSNASLTDTLMLVQRLAILDPVQGISGAAFAVREFLNGEYLSLVRRLELDRRRLIAIRDASGGDQAKMIAGLSAYIDEMGMTNDALREMGASGANAFRVLRSEGTETLAVFFNPFLNDVMIPLTRAFRDFLRELRKTSPELQKFVGIAAGLVSLSALGTSLPLLGAIPGGAMIGKAGVYGAAAYGGAQLGAYAARKAGLPGTEGKSQNEVLSQAFTTFKQLVFITGTAVGEIVKAFIWVAEQIDNVWDSDLKPAWDKITSGLHDIVQDFKDLADQIPGVNFPVERPLTRPGQPIEYFPQAGPEGPFIEVLPPTFDESFERVTQALEDSGQAADDSANKWEQARQRVDDFTLSLGKGLGLLGETTSWLDSLTNALATLKGVVVGVVQAAQARQTPVTITDDLLAAWQQYKQDMQDIEAQANADLEQETREHEARKADIIRRFAEQVAEMLEDESIRYARALAETQRRERSIRQSLQEQLEESNAALAKTVADLNERYYEEQEKATEEHLRALRLIQRDGKESILKAAANLDARGVWEAQRNMRNRLADEKDRYDRQNQERREALDEALTDEREHYDERLRLARENADKQIRQLWEQFNREEALRAEDFQRRLTRMQQQHQRELTEQDVAHQSRLQQIRDQAAQERTAREQAFVAEFNAAQTHQRNMLGVMRSGNAALERELMDWYTGMRNQMSTFARTGRQTESTRSRSYQTGGPIWRTGLFKGEAGEEVLRADIAKRLRRMMGGSISQPGLLEMMRQTTNTGARIYGDVSIPLYLNDAGDYTESQLRRFLRDEFGNALAGIGAA